MLCFIVSSILELDRCGVYNHFFFRIIIIFDTICILIISNLIVVIFINYIETLLNYYKTIEYYS